MDRARKRELKASNLRVWAGEKDIFAVQPSQDSSLKKNTAFIKRLRTSVTQTNIPVFIQDVKTLSLHKYLSEIVSACYEGLCKLKTPAEIAAAIEVVSALHQRFGPAEFTGYLGWLIGRGLSTPDKSYLKTLSNDVREREEKDRLTRQRGLIRVATEFWLVGILRNLNDVVCPEFEAKGKDAAKTAEPSAKAKATAAAKNGADDDPFPLEILKDLLGHDREHTNLPLVVIFVKAFAWDTLGIKQRNVDGRKTGVAEGEVKPEESSAKPEEASAAVEDESDDPPFTPPDLRQRFKNVFARYFEDVKAHLIRDQKTLLAQGRRNAEVYVRSGEIFEDRQAHYDKQVKSQEKLIQNAQSLADIIGAEMPDLKDKDEGHVLGEGSIGLVKAGDYLRGQGEGPGIWEDEEERRFYENLVDLKDRVHILLLEDGKKKKGDGDEQVGKKADAKPTENDSAEANAPDADDQTTAIANKSMGAKVDGLLARLPDLHSKDMVDQFSVDFCSVNSKASRNRLIKALQDVPKGRTDLLPLYSRIVAILSKYMPDVSQGVITHLDEEFRSLQRRKSKEFLGSARLLNIRYVAELTKFGIVPEHVIFHCFKVCLDDLHRNNIEIVGNLMENCGRYLLRNPETSPRMVSFLETLQRKKSAQHMDQRERLILENAIYYVNPPERPAIEQKERTPMELFIQKVVYDDLTKRNVDRITKQLRKLHWEEQDVVVILRKVFTRPGKMRYNNIHLLAVILSVLHRYHSKFTINVIDDVLESITRNLEINDVRFNQRRVAQVKYLGELYVYRMVDSTLIFDTMYKILTFGHEGGMPKPNSDNPLDAPNDWFRIRLICILLETCASFFDKGPAKKKLDFFITFFQYYINTKESCPPDIEFAIQDAFAVVSRDLKLIDNLDEAAAQFSEAVKQNYQQPAVIEKTVEVEDGDEDSLSDEGPEDEDDADDSSTENSEEEEGDDSAHSENGEQDERIVVKRQEDERDPELEADFDRELAKLMAESMDARKERKARFDVPLPMRPTQRDPSIIEKRDGPEIAHGPGHMKFGLLTKKGNKQQTRDIDLPADSGFAIAMRHQQQAEKEEQQRIKNLVLNLDLRDENDGPDGTPLEKHAPNPYLQPRGVDKAGKGRASQRGRQLQVSDLDWT